MLLSAVVHLRSLRWVIPETLLIGCTPIYLSIWGCWRVLTSVLPAQIFYYGDDFMWSSYQRFVLFFVENFSGLKVHLYGDFAEVLEQKENVIYMSNHQTTVDWVVTNMLAVRQGSIGHIRYVLKDGLKFLPLYGFYFGQHGSIYIKRSGKFNRKKAGHQMKYLSKNNIPVWLVVFPEGTRFNPELPHVITKSQEFAKEQGLTAFSHLLTPRIKALQLAVEELSDYVSAIYDVTVAYSGTQNPESGERTTAPGVPEMLAGYSKEVHIHVRRIPCSEVPEGEISMRHWLNGLYTEKERMLEQFYSKDVEKSGKFPGKSVTSKLGLMQTFPPALFWSSAFIFTMATEEGRSLYWKISLGALAITFLHSAIRV